MRCDSHRDQEKSLPMVAAEHTRSKRLAATIGSAFLLLLLGCGQQEEITRYKVPPMERTTFANSNSPMDDALPFGHPGTTGGVAPALSATSGAVVGEPTRTLAIIVPAPTADAAWFFKLMGPEQAVGEHVEEFVALAGSIEYSSQDDADPTWNVPESWTNVGSSGMRLATYRMKADPTLEVSLIKLPARDGVDDAYTRDNVNRWRNEVGLPPLSGDDWRASAVEDGSLTVIQEGPPEVVMVNVAGKRKTAGMRPPFAGGPASLPKASQPPGAMKSDLKYTAPAEWKETGASVMTQAGFDIIDGEHQARVTVSVAGGDELANVNRWRDQIGLEPWSADELKEKQETVNVDGHQGLLVNLTGDAETILGSIVDVEGRSWFIKLRGETELAEQQRAAFKAFVESIEF